MKLGSQRKCSRRLAGAARPNLELWLTLTASWEESPNQHQFIFNQSPNDALKAVCEKPSGARALKHQLTASSLSERNHVSLLLQSMEQNATPALFHVVFQRCSWGLWALNSGLVSKQGARADNDRYSNACRIMWKLFGQSLFLIVFPSLSVSVVPH